MSEPHPIEIEPFADGSLVEGRYLLGAMLGKGGMGVVFRAKDTVGDRDVAVKFVHRAFLKTEGALSRFVREAAASAAIPSEHVVRVHDAAVTADGMPFIVMELLHGEELSAIYRREGRLEIDRAATLMIQASIGLHLAHVRGIVHRDLKLGNCFVTRRKGGEVLKVLDFGVSKLLGTEEHMTALTGAGTMVGTPIYMAPEQMLASRNADARCDIYSLGIMTFQLMTGQFPIEMKSRQLIDVVRATMSNVRRPVRDFLPNASSDLEEAVSRASRPKAEERFQTILEYAKALLPFAGEARSRLTERLQGLTDGTPTDTTEVDSALRRFRARMPSQPGKPRTLGADISHKNEEDSEHITLHITPSMLPKPDVSPTGGVVPDVQAQTEPARSALWRTLLVALAISAVGLALSYVVAKFISSRISYSGDSEGLNQIRP